jgi:hypothetical protein
MNELSLIIGHRENSEERKNNLEFLISYYNRILKNTNYEIIIVEQDETQKLKLSDNFKHIFAFNKKYYNRSWGFNIGIRNAKYENILCIDNDIILPKKEIEIGLNNLSETKVFVPYEMFWDMNKEVSDNFKKEQDLVYVFSNTATKKVTERYNGVDSKHQLKFGGAFMVEKSFYLKYPFMVEEFEQYGAEDENSMFIYSKILLNMKKDTQPRNRFGNMFHLYHERIDYVKLREDKDYQKNCILMERNRSLSYEQTINYINSYKDKIGNIFKYENNI